MKKKSGKENKVWAITEKDSFTAPGAIARVHVQNVIAPSPGFIADAREVHEREFILRG